MKLANLMTAAAFVLVSSTALAGYTQPAPVDVDIDAMMAQGDMFTARGAEEPNVFIGCGVRNIDDGAGGIFNYGFCQAEDAEGDHVLCTTFNSALVDAIASTSDYAFLTFYWVDDGSGNLECNYVGSSTQSFYLPKK